MLPYFHLIFFLKITPQINPPTKSIKNPTNFYTFTLESDFIKSKLWLIRIRNFQAKVNQKIKRNCQTYCWYRIIKIFWSKGRSRHPTQKNIKIFIISPYIPRKISFFCSINFFLVSFVCWERMRIETFCHRNWNVFGSPEKREYRFL